MNMSIEARKKLVTMLFEQISFRLVAKFFTSQ